MLIFKLNYSFIILIYQNINAILNTIATIVASPIPLNSIAPNVIFIPLNPTVKITDVRIKFLAFEKSTFSSNKYS